MTYKPKFTKEEWQLIADGPEWVFAALTAADGNAALTTKVKESKAFKDVVKNYAGSSEFVKEVLEDTTKTSREVKSATLSDAEQALEAINKFLEAKLPLPEANQYRKFLTDVAESVAEAAGEGALGIGEKISKNEAKAIEKIKTALKPTAAAKVEAKPAAQPAVKPAEKPAAKPAERPAIKPATKPVAQKPIARPVSQAPEKPVRPQAAPAMPQIPSQEVAKKPEYLAEHTVAQGETLSHISLKYYGSAVKAKYMIIYEANKDVIGDNPNMIRPGTVLNIPKLEE